MFCSLFTLRSKKAKRTWVKFVFLFQSLKLWFWLWFCGIKCVFFTQIPKLVIIHKHYFILFMKCLKCVSRNKMYIQNTYNIQYNIFAKYIQSKYEFISSAKLKCENYILCTKLVCFCFWNIIKYDMYLCVCDKVYFSSLENTIRK